MNLGLLKGGVFSIFFLMLCMGNAQGLDDSSLLEESRFWPMNVTVLDKIVGKTHGNTVPAGGEWAFLRYENGLCLVDMGHNGIFRFKVDQTDLLERMRRISKERTYPFQGLFTFRYTKSFYLPESPERGLTLGALDEYDYFVLFYFNYEKSSEAVAEVATVIDTLKDPGSAMSDIAVLLLPENDFRADGLLDSYVADGLTAPTILPFWTNPIRYALSHDVERNGDVVIVDKFGKILGQFFQSDLQASTTRLDLIDSIETILK